MTTKTDEVIDAPADRTLVLTRVFDAPRKLVWDVWTNREHLAKWSAPRGFTLIDGHGDLRVSGAWGFVLIAPDGDRNNCNGVYREIVPGERLVMSHGWTQDDGTRTWETIVTLQFEDAGAGKTKLTLEQKIFRSVESRDLHNDGWSQCLDKLADLVGRMAAEATPHESPNHEIVVSRVFDAPRELVWDAWTDPKQVVKWWGPHGFTTTIEEMNVKPGGMWKHVMRGPDGTEYPNESIFTEVVKPERIVYTHSGRKTGGPEVQFVATWSFDVVAENKTRLTVRQVFPTVEMRNMVAHEFGAIEGAKQTLARLAEELAKP